MDDVKGPLVFDSRMVAVDESGTDVGNSEANDTADCDNVICGNDGTPGDL